MRRFTCQGCRRRDFQLSSAMIRTDAGTVRMCSDCATDAGTIARVRSEATTYVRIRAERDASAGIR